MKKQTNETTEKEKRERPTEFSKHNIKIVEWKNTSKDGKEFNTYNVSKFYKDGEDWKTTESLNYTDLYTLYFLLMDVLLNRYPSKEKLPDSKKE